MRIAFLTRRPTEGRSVTNEIVRLLRAWGAEIDCIEVDARATELGAIGVEHDLYVLRSVNEATLSYAGILESLGGRCVNSHHVSRLCRDKALVAGLLQRAGVPVPTTWMVERPTQLAEMLCDGPIVLKPQHGSQGRGVQVVWDVDELGEVGSTGGPVLAQRFHPRKGRDRKLYCIGGQLFGVKRVWPATTYEQKQGEPFTVTGELREIAHTVGDVIGFDLFGIDVVVSGDQPYVVDVNPFPGFKGVPEAALRLADYIYATAAGDAADPAHAVVAGAP